jgi:hypothetical protein
VQGCVGVGIGGRRHAHCNWAWRRSVIVKPLLPHDNAWTVVPFCAAEFSNLVVGAHRFCITVMQRLQLHSLCSCCSNIVDVWLVQNDVLPCNGSSCKNMNSGSGSMA